MNQEKEDAIQAAFNKVPGAFKEDLALALDWARLELYRKEGGGHIFEVHPHDENHVNCTFSKPEWPGEHQGRAMFTGAEAVVMAVCEYLNGA